MIRDFSLADLITLSNGFAGTGTILATLQYMDTRDQRILWLAFALPLFAMVFDFLDGRVARWRHRSSPLGRELDSLADLVSFGVAPAAIAYAVGLDTAVDQIVLVYFVLCGLSRLARFNVTADSLGGADGKVPYFEGTPIPSSVLPLAILLIAYRHGALLPVAILDVRFHLTVLLFALSGSLMISKTLRVPKP